MYFEGRALKSLAGAVAADQLAVGQIYFIAEFIDAELLLPRIEPVTFIGRDLTPGDSGELYFQDAESYRAGLRFGEACEAGEEPMFIKTPVGSMRPVFNFEDALESLLACSLRREERSP